MNDTEYTEPTRALPPEAKRALTTLLTQRFITRAKHRAVFEALLGYEEQIRARLADMYLELVIDHEYEVAFKRQEPDSEGPKMLRRDKPLSRDASLLLIQLRKELMYTDSVTARGSSVTVSEDQITEMLRPFRGDIDGDDAKFQRRVHTAIRAIVELRLLTEVSEAEHLYTISEAVAVLIGPDELQRMARHFIAQAHQETHVDPERAPQG